MAHKYLIRNRMLRQMAPELIGALGAVFVQCVVLYAVNKIYNIHQPWHYYVMSFTVQWLFFVGCITIKYKK
jgi:hypothetical protein